MEYLFFGGGIIYFIAVVIVMIISGLSYLIAGIGVSAHLIKKEFDKEKEEKEFYNEWL